MFLGRWCQTPTDQSIIPATVDGAQGDAASVDPAMVRRDGPDLHRLRHHGHVDHGIGEAGRVGRSGVEGKLQGGAVELPHLLVGDNDAGVCLSSCLRWDPVRPTCLLPLLCREDVQQIRHPTRDDGRDVSNHKKNIPEILILDEMNC